MPHHCITRIATAVAAVAATATPALAAESEIVPGITYERLVRDGTVVHVTRITQGPLVSVRPERISGEVDTRGLLTRALGARARGGALLGVNGDYFNWDNGYPSGLLVLGGELVHEPEATRSALVFTGGGRLTSAKTALAGQWIATNPTSQVETQLGFIGMNRPAERDAETILYTPRFGDPTPTGDRADALIQLAPGSIVGANREVSGVVQSVTPGGGVVAGPGQVVLAGVGPAPRARVEAFLKPATPVRINPAVAGLPADVIDAIGGGPVLVSDGRAIRDANEGFSFGQVGVRSARTAVGQMGDGRVLMVVSEGPLEGSTGMTTAAQADLVASLGAQTAVAMDSGGSSTMAVRTRVVNRMAAGERRISNAVIVRYGGVQLTDPDALITPNGDGLAERTGSYARSAKDGTVRITLNRTGGRAVKLLYAGRLGPSARALRLAGANVRVPDGAYQIVARFSPDDGSPRSSHTRALVIDRTLGHVKVAKVGTGAKAKLRLGYRLARAARVTVIVRNARGQGVKVLMRSRRMPAGARAAVWDMKRKGKRLAPGVYSVSISTRTTGPSNEITRRFRVVKVAEPAPKP